MKNKKAKKTYSSTKKKTSNAKIAVTVFLVFVLLCGAVVGTIAAISDGFTKPVEEWFSDKATVTPGDDQGDQTTPGGNDQGDQTGDETVCKHVFEYGVCTKCRSTVKEVIPLATRVVSPDEDCIVNFWTQDYQLIESKTVKGGDTFEGIEGYNDYIFLFDNTLSVQSYEDVNVGDVLVDGKFYSISEYSNANVAPFAAALPHYFKDSYVEGLYINGNAYCFCKYNGRYLGINGDAINIYYKPIDGMDVNDLFAFFGASEVVLKLKEGDTFEFLSYMPNQFLYVYDDIMCIPFELVYPIPEESPIYKYSLDVVNIVVIDYETGDEVA